MTKYKKQGPLAKMLGMPLIPARHNPHGIAARENAREEERTGTEKGRTGWDLVVTHGFKDFVFDHGQVICKGGKNMLFVGNKIEWRWNTLEAIVLEGIPTLTGRARQEPFEHMLAGRTGHPWQLARLPHPFRDPRYRSGTPLTSVDKYALRVVSNPLNVLGAKLAGTGQTVGGACCPNGLENLLCRHRDDFITKLYDALKMNGTLDTAIDLGYIDPPGKTCRSFPSSHLLGTKK